MNQESNKETYFNCSDKKTTTSNKETYFNCSDKKTTTSNKDTSHQPDTIADMFKPVNEVTMIYYAMLGCSFYESKNNDVIEN